MNRSEFLRRATTAGLLFSASDLALYCAKSDEGRLPGKHGNDPLLNAQAMGLSSPILQAINCGITAPNPHNTQPWLFQILNDRSMNLIIDARRMLPQTDPPARQIHIGQGAFLEHLSVGASVLGYHATIALFPGGLQAYKIGRPLARVTLEKSTGAKRPDEKLYSAMSIRSTNRSAYSDRPVTAETIEELKKLMGEFATRATFLLNQAEIKKYNDIFFEGMRIEVTTRAKNEESRIWFRYSDSEIYQKRDGISLPGNAITGLRRYLAAYSMQSEEGFHDPSGLEQYLNDFKEKLATTKAHAFIQTENNSHRDWINAGRAYGRFGLAAAHLGLAMHPLSQVLQEFPEMDSARKAFQKMGSDSGAEKTQMIARMGYSNYQFIAPRRSLKSMLAT